MPQFLSLTQDGFLKVGKMKFEDVGTYTLSLRSILGSQTPQAANLDLIIHVIQITKPVKLTPTDARFFIRN